MRFLCFLTSLGESLCWLVLLSLSQSGRVGCSDLRSFRMHISKPLTTPSLSGQTAQNRIAGGALTLEPFNKSDEVFGVLDEIIPQTVTNSPKEHLCTSSPAGEACSTEFLKSPLIIFNGLAEIKLCRTPLRDRLVHSRTFKRIITPPRIRQGQTHTHIHTS